jgi:hypothetical protein
MTDMHAQLNKIRSDAAECLLLSSLANSDKQEMFAKMADHLNSLAREIEKQMAVQSGDVPFVEHRSTEFSTDPLPDHHPLVASRPPVAANPATQSRRFLPWLLLVAVVLMAGMLLRTNEFARTFLPLPTLPWKQAAPPAQDDPKQASDGERERKLVTEQMDALAVRLGSFEKVLDDFKTASPATEPPAILTNNLAAARRELEANAALLNKANDEATQSRKSSEAAATALQDERKKTAALANDLAEARRDLQTKAALLGKASDETAELKKTAETTAAALQEERKKISALASIDAARPPDHTAGVDAKSTAAAPSSGQAATTGPTPGVAHLMARAQALLSQGDINGARIVLERVIEVGSARANFAIAETYDPRVLSHWNVYGIRGDPAKARELYAKAAAGGVEEAKDRLAALHE